MTWARPNDNPLEPYERSAHRLESLDSIRGLAALAVLFSHVINSVFAWPDPWIEWSRYPLISWAFDGTAAVAMFFVLSGFVLARPYVSGAVGELNIPVFYVRRVIRIWFPWFCAFVLSLACRCFLFRNYPTHPPPDYRMWQTPVLLQNLLLQCVFLAHGRAQLLPQDWTLGIELIGSALIPPFIAIVKRPLHLVWLSALALVLVVAVPHDEFFSAGGCYYVSFVIGVLIARHQDRLVGWLKRLTVGGRLMVLGVGLAVYGSARLFDHFGYNGMHLSRTLWFLRSAGAGLIIVTTLSSRRVASFLTQKPISWLGTISYSVYLLQFIVLLCVLPPAIALFNKLGFAAGPWMVPFCLVLAVIGTVILAVPFHRLVELPSIALGHYVSGNWKERMGDQTAPAVACEGLPRTEPHA